jgi:hypothetical protein
MDKSHSYLISPYDVHTTSTYIILLCKIVILYCSFLSDFCFLSSSFNAYLQYAPKHDSIVLVPCRLAARSPVHSSNRNKSHKSTLQFPESMSFFWNEYHNIIILTIASSQARKRRRVDNELWPQNGKVAAWGADAEVDFQPSNYHLLISLRARQRKFQPFTRGRWARCI